MAVATRPDPAGSLPGQVSMRSSSDQEQTEFAPTEQLGVARCCNLLFMEQEIDEVLAREVATVTLADVRTVRRVLRGEHVRGLVGARIRAELERRGVDSRSRPQST